MTSNNKRGINTVGKIMTVLMLTVFIFFQACRIDDPKPVNEEEVITTVEVTLVPAGGGQPVNLRFFDEDGERGNIAPVITVSAALAASTDYAATIELKNETSRPEINVSEEVAEEATDHLFCFDVHGGIAIEYGDEDEGGMPIGLLTMWRTEDAGTAEVTVSLRHQAGTKTGECPGLGETDIAVTFTLTIE